MEEEFRRRALVIRIVSPYIIGMKKQRVGDGITIEQLMKLRTGTGEGHLPEMKFDTLLDEMIALKTQVQEQESTISDLSAKAMADPLTGLANRRTFEAEMKKSIATAERYARQHGLLMIDVNDFKAVNDRLGHLAGDEVLKHISKLIRQNIRKTDIAARLGGDEFCIILNELKSAGNATERARAIQDVIAATPLITADFTIQISISIGHCVFNADDTLEDVVHAADTAMYKDKARGKQA